MHGHRQRVSAQFFSHQQDVYNLSLAASVFSLVCTPPCRPTHLLSPTPSFFSWFTPNLSPGYSSPRRSVWTLDPRCQFLSLFIFPGEGRGEGESQSLLRACPSLGSSWGCGTQIFFRVCPFLLSSVRFFPARDTEHQALLSLLPLNCLLLTAGHQVQFSGTRVLMLLGCQQLCSSVHRRHAMQPDLDRWVPDWHGRSHRKMARVGTLLLPHEGKMLSNFFLHMLLVKKTQETLSLIHPRHLFFLHPKNPVKDLIHAKSC